MPRPNPIPQRYRLTFEFTLRDRGDYTAVRRNFEFYLKGTVESYGGLADYCAIEKVEDSNAP